MSAGLILAVDDDPSMRCLLAVMLERAGYESREAANGRAGLRELYSTHPDLVILDVKMPQLDGWQTLERIRDMSDVPVLMLTAQEGEMERVRGLEAGADDYVAKPFGHQELLARVRRSIPRSAGRIQAPTVYADELLSIDFAHREVRYENREIRLTPLEFRLLAAFTSNPNHVLSHDQLLHLAWRDPVACSPEQVKLYVSYLRRKLNPLDPRATPLETVRGFGYRYRPPQSG